MKGALLACAAILTISSSAFPSDIKGTVSTIDINGGAFEVCGVEVVTSHDWTIIEDRLKRPAALSDLAEGDYVEIEGRFIEPAKLEATQITLGRVIASGPTAEIIDEDDMREAAGTAPEAASEAAPEPERIEEPRKPVPPEPADAPPPPPAAEKLSGRLRNADAKTRILIVNGTIVNLEPGARIFGANKAPLSLSKLKRGCRVECEGTKRSKKEFSARTVRVVK